MTEREAVQRGIAVIEEKVPGGLDNIDLNSVDVTSYTNCYACQATGIPDYIEAINELEVRGGVDFGFAPNGRNSDELDKEWARQITAKREARVPVLA